MEPTRDRLSQLSEASFRINESPDVGTALRSWTSWICRRAHGREVPLTEMLLSEALS